jgi:hypothetical protein
MDHNIFKIPVMSFIFRTGRAIPIASAKEDPKMLDAAYEEIAMALQDAISSARFAGGCARAMC